MLSKLGKQRLAVAAGIVAVVGLAYDVVSTNYKSEQKRKDPSHIQVTGLPYNNIQVTKVDILTNGYILEAHAEMEKGGKIKCDDHACKYTGPITYRIDMNKNYRTDSLGDRMDIATRKGSIEFIVQQ